jgi:hypothetical protein
MPDFSVGREAGAQDHSVAALNGKVDVIGRTGGVTICLRISWAISERPAGWRLNRAQSCGSADGASNTKLKMPAMAA